MLETPDLAVLGAGPAGIRAALSARAAGLTVLMVDEAPSPGGQGYRARSDGAPAKDADGRRADRLRQALAASGVPVLQGHRVWTVSTQPIRLASTGPSPVKTIQPRALLVAAGATERVLPFPGWTLPGVIGLGAATVLLKAPGPLPPGPAVVAGRGPLLALAAAGLLARGMDIACVVDEASRADWLRALPGLLSRPDLLARGAMWLARLRGAGVPVLHGHAVVRALGNDALQGVCIRPLSGSARAGRTVPARLLAVGQGLVPATELLSLFGVPLRFRPEEAAWAPDLAPGGRTGIAGLYAAGDGTGIRGAAAAELAGHLAGLAVAQDVGARPASRPIRSAAKLRRADRAGAAMARLMTPGADRVAAIAGDTVVCRCEDVTRATIDGVLAGVSDLNQLKTRTRCGMGPCQGRVCAPAVAALAALHPHLAQPVRPWTVRPPLRAVPIGDLVGAFGYADIPAVKPAI